MVDIYPGSTNPADAAAGFYAAITPSDTVNLAYLTRAIYVGSGGVIQAVRDDNTVVPFLGAVTGSIIPIRCKRVNAASTTASGLVALF